MLEFENAKDKVLMGAERRSMVMTQKEKELTAYHEAGHALVGVFTPGNDPLHKVTIIPRGRALGVTMNLPERDRYSETKTEMKAKIAMMFGGRAAEEIIFGKDHVTSGASNDILQATNKARSMVVEWGMSDKLGPLKYTENEEEVFLGKSVSQRKTMSDETAKIIDEEIKVLVEAGESHAKKILKKNMKHLHSVANALLEYETLSGKDVSDLIKGKKIKVKDNNDDTRKTSMPKTNSSNKRSKNIGINPEPAVGS